MFSNEVLFPCLDSLVYTRGRFVVFETVMQTQDAVEDRRIEVFCFVFLLYETRRFLVSFAAVFWDVTQRSQKTAAKETRRFHVAVRP